MNNNTIANLAGNTDDLFLEVINSMEKSSVKSVWDKNWFSNICGKQAFYRGLSQFYKVKSYFQS